MRNDGNTTLLGGTEEDSHLLGCVEETYLSHDQLVSSFIF